MNKLFLFLQAKVRNTSVSIVRNIMQKNYAREDSVRRHILKFCEKAKENDQ